VFAKANVTLEAKTELLNIYKAAVKFIEDKAEFNDNLVQPKQLIRILQA